MTNSSMFSKQQLVKLLLQMVNRYNLLMTDSTKLLSSRKQNCWTWTSAKEWFPGNKWVSKKQRRETEVNITMWYAAEFWLEIGLSHVLPLWWTSWVYFWHTATHTQRYPAAVFCHFPSKQQDGETQSGLKCLVQGDNIMTRPVLKPQPWALWYHNNTLPPQVFRVREQYNREL